MPGRKFNGKKAKNVLYVDGTHMVLNLKEDGIIWSEFLKKTYIPLSSRIWGIKINVGSWDLDRLLNQYADQFQCRDCQILYAWNGKVFDTLDAAIKSMLDLMKSGEDNLSCIGRIYLSPMKVFYSEIISEDFDAGFDAFYSEVFLILEYLRKNGFEFHADDLEETYEERLRETVDGVYAIEGEPLVICESYYHDILRIAEAETAIICKAATELKGKAIKDKETAVAFLRQFKGNMTLKIFPDYSDAYSHSYFWYWLKELEMDETVKKTLPAINDDGSVCTGCFWEENSLTREVQETILKYVNSWISENIKNTAYRLDWARTMNPPCAVLLSHSHR